MYDEKNYVERWGDDGNNAVKYYNFYDNKWSV